MIVCLSCSMNSYANNSTYSPTGEEVKLVASNDSVMISYNDLRIVTGKLIELEYEKEINSKLKTIIYNDSITIASYENVNKQLNKDCKKAIKQRNISLGVGITAIVCTILTLLLK